MIIAYQYQFQVLIGQNLNFTLTDELQYVPATTIPSTATTIQIQVIIGVGVSVVVILFILILVTLIVTLVCGYHRNIKRRKENLLNSIELKNLHQREMKPADVYGKPIHIMFIQHGLTSDHRDKPASLCRQ